MYSMATHPDADTIILDEYRAGNRDQAITAFVRQHQKQVYAIALRFLDSPEDARDCTQDVLIKAIASLNTFRGESSLSTWVSRIARNTAITMYNRRRWIQYLPFGSGDGEREVVSQHLSPFESTANNEFELFFRKVLRKLPPKQRETFMMRHFEDLTFEEISSQLGTSVGAQKANYHWAVKKIAQLLQGTEYYSRWIHNNDKAQK